MPISRNAKYFLPVMTLSLALLTAMSPLAIDTYLSSMPKMAEFFGVKISQIELTLTLYFLGFAIGNFLGGPLSDAFGRKKLAVTGIVLYGIAAVIIPIATRIEEVWILRAIQAFGGGFASVTAMVFVRDWFEGKEVARMATIIGMIMMFAPLLAPIIGTALGEWKGWHSIFHFLSIYSALLFVIFLFIMPESRAKEHLTHRITGKQFISKYQTFFQSKPAVLLLLATAFSMSGMFVFITSSSFIYLEYFGMESRVFPLLFGANVVLNVALSFTNNILLKKFEPIKMLGVGLGLQLLAGIAIYVSTMDGEAHFVPVFASIVLYVGSLGMVFGNATALILNLLPQIAGSANAMIGVTRFVMSFLIGSLPALFYTGDLRPVGTVMFCCTLAALILFSFYRKETIKQKI